MIAWNYPVALLLNYGIYKPEIALGSIPLPQWGTYLMLGFLLPSIFLVIAYSIQSNGITRTEIAQRISILIPISAAFVLFNEQATPLSLLGIGIGIVAVIGSLQRKDAANPTRKNAWVFPLLIFLGMGIIDVLFKYITQFSTPYTLSIFLVFSTALIVSFLYVSGTLLKSKEKLSAKSALGGILLGLFNFGNILFYMKAHKAIPENPSIVFMAMNIGVIALGAIVGMGLFKEKLSLLNKMAILLAILSIIIIARNEFI